MLEVGGFRDYNGEQKVALVLLLKQKRGTPFGIRFWYKAGENWPSSHQRGGEAEFGCVGCGWYDFETWRDALNRKLAEFEGDG